MRKEKKPTAKEAIQRMQVAEQKYLYLRLKLENIQANLLETMYVYEKIMEALLEKAGTIHEARRWYRDYREAVNSVNPESDNHRKDLLAALAEKGFIINETEMIDAKQELYDQWEKDRDRRSA